MYTCVWGVDTGILWKEKEGETDAERMLMFTISNALQNALNLTQQSRQLFPSDKMYFEESILRSVKIFNFSYYIHANSLETT